MLDSFRGPQSTRLLLGESWVRGRFPCSKSTPKLRISQVSFCHNLLGDRDALDGEELLRVDGLIDGDEVGLEPGDFLEFFEADDGECGGGEFVFARALGAAGFAFGSAGSSALLRVAAVCLC